CSSDLTLSSENPSNLIAYGFDDLNRKSDSADSVSNSIDPSRTTGKRAVPTETSAFFQDRVNLGDGILEGGLRWDRFDANWKSIADLANPLDDNGRLKLRDSRAHSRLSPRASLRLDLPGDARFGA